MQKEFCDVSNRDALQIHELISIEGSDWRTVKTGLNIYGICENEKCKAFKKKVICNMGVGVYDINYDSDSVECPMCGKIFNGTCCGFYNCIYHFKGLKLDENIKIETPIKIAGKKLDYFNHKTGGLVTWKRLKIFTYRLNDGNDNDDRDSRCFICLKNSKKKEVIITNDKCKHLCHKNCYDELMNCGIVLEPNECLFCRH